ncbi:MAG: hypothetical protein ACYS8L_08195 [Planctomycetota bacterium]
MKMVAGTTFVLAAVLLWAAMASVTAFAEEEAPPPAAEAPEAEVAPAEGVVEMVELTLEGRKVRGRVVFEDDELLRVERLGAGVIGYRKELVKEVKRFTMSPEAYLEQIGDHHHAGAWDSEDSPAPFIKARQAYQRALAQSTGTQDRARLSAKLEALAADRVEWQKEALRREEIRQARHETELIKVETEVARQKLDALKRQEEQIQQLWAALRQMEQHRAYVLAALDDFGRALEDLEEDVDRLRHLDRIYIRNTVFLDLKRSHMDLRRQVDRLTQRLSKE